MEERQPKVAGKIEDIRKSLDKDNFSEIAQWGTAARWVQIYQRANL